MSERLVRPAEPEWTSDRRQALDELTMRHDIFEYWMTKVDSGEMTHETAFEVITNEFEELDEQERYDGAA